MLLEPNPYHSEVLPGITKYFEDLGYVVDVYIRKEVIGQDVFCRYKIKGKIFPFSIEQRNALFRDVAGKYEYLFLSSMEWCENGETRRFLDELSVVPKTRYGILGMYHSTLHMVQFNEERMLHEGRLFCISDFQRNEFEELTALAPIYFGEINEKIDSEKNNGKIIFLSIGSSMHLEKLSSEYWKLSREERKKIEFRHIGPLPAVSRWEGHLWHRVVKSIVACVIPKYRNIDAMKCLGKVNFDVLYDELEKADFVLVLLNDDEIDGRYLKVGTSGIRQSILGFKKISIIQNIYGNYYGIKEGARISLQKWKVADAIRVALHIRNENYKLYKENVATCATQIYDESLNNLKGVLQRIEGGGQ